MHAFASPVIDDRELDERNGQLLDHDVLKDPHKRDLVAHLDADVVAHQRVDQIHRFSLHSSFNHTAKPADVPNRLVVALEIPFRMRPRRLY